MPVPAPVPILARQDRADFRRTPSPRQHGRLEHPARREPRPARPPIWHDLGGVVPSKPSHPAGCRMGPGPNTFDGRESFSRRPVASAHFTCLSRPPERMWTDAACPRPPPQEGTESMTPHETGSTTTPGDSRATAPPPAHVRSPGADPGRSHRRLPPGLPGPAVPVPRAPPAAGPPISPRASAAPHGPPR